MQTIFLVIPEPQTGLQLWKNAGQCALDSLWCGRSWPFWLLLIFCHFMCTRLRLCGCLLLFF